MITVLDFPRTIASPKKHTAMFKILLYDGIIQTHKSG
jgi:hypothetical protein